MWREWATEMFLGARLSILGCVACQWSGRTRASAATKMAQMGVLCFFLQRYPTLFCWRNLPTSHILLQLITPIQHVHLHWSSHAQRVGDCRLCVGTQVQDKTVASASCGFCGKLPSSMDHVCSATHAVHYPESIPATEPQRTTPNPRAST